MNDGDWRQPSRQQADRGARLCSAGGGRPWLRPLGFSTVWLPTRLSAPDAQSAQRPTAAIFWRSPAAAIGQLSVSSMFLFAMVSFRGLRRELLGGVYLSRERLPHSAVNSSNQIKSNHNARAKTRRRVVPISVTPRHRRLHPPPHRRTRGPGYRAAAAGSACCPCSPARKSCPA